MTVNVVHYMGFRRWLPHQEAMQEDLPAKRETTTSVIRLAVWLNIPRDRLNTR
jgi:hypothetical protein